MNKATIVNIYKHKITHKNLKGKLKKQIIFSVSIFSILLCAVCYSKIFLAEKTNSVYRQASAIYNPLSKLYNEEDDAIFINNLNALILSKDLHFILPVRSGDIKVTNGDVIITVQDSIMVYAPEGGIVAECGVSNFNTKYIKIMHNESIYSIIDNVEVIGCEKGDVVKKGREIATATPNSAIKISIYNNNEKLLNLSVVKNNIEWM